MCVFPRTSICWYFSIESRSEIARILVLSIDLSGSLRHLRHLTFLPLTQIFFAFCFFFFFDVDVSFGFQNNSP